MLGHIYLSMIEYPKWYCHVGFDHKRLCYKRATAGTFILNLLYKDQKKTLQIKQEMFLMDQKVFAINFDVTNRTENVLHGTKSIRDQKKFQKEQKINQKEQEMFQKTENVPKRTENVRKWTEICSNEKEQKMCHMCSIKKYSQTIHVLNQTEIISLRKVRDN